MNWRQSFERSGYKSSYAKEKRRVPRCACGLRKRGPNHDEGAEHKAHVIKQRGK
jgi:hypothetical protein